MLVNVTTPLEDAIASLYKQASIAPPTEQQPISPLADLLEEQNIFHTQLSGLCSRAALAHLLRRGGLVEPLEAVDDDLLAGYFYANGHIATIFVEQNDIVVRRRFSAAHELGHYVLHFLPMIADGKTSMMTDSFLQVEEETELDELPEGCITFTRPGESVMVPAMADTMMQMEREANQFAAELLMPTQVISALVERHQPLVQGEDLVWRLATDMLVSRAAMRWRLRNLGVLSAVA